MASVDLSQRTHSFNKIKTGKSQEVVLQVQTTAGKGAKSVSLDRKAAAKLIEAQRRMTDAEGNRVVGGKGVTKKEVKGIFTSVRDAGNANGKARYITAGERAVLDVMDAARNDKAKVMVNGQEIDLTGHKGTTSGAEGEFVAQRKALAADIAKKNLFGTPVPSKAV